MSSVVFVLALSLASASPVAQLEPQPAAPEVERGHTRWGLLLDAGLPDALGASLLFRPLPWLRFNGGVATNTVGFGARAGVGIAFYFPITPSLNLDVGHFFPTDYRPLFERFGQQVPTGPERLVLQRFGYDFASAMVGLELGSPRHFSFFVRAGLSYWSIRVEATQDILREVTDDASITARPFTLRFTAPAAKLGFLIYFG
jgi:hypothetical protein